MADACRAANRLVAGRSEGDLATDETLMLALSRAIEIIGEAASQVSAQTRDEIPQIPWRGVTAMRNRLVHAYFDINRAVRWKAASVEVPGLLRELDAILAHE